MSNHPIIRSTLIAAGAAASLALLAATVSAAPVAAWNAVGAGNESNIVKIQMDRDHMRMHRRMHERHHWRRGRGHRPMMRHMMNHDHM